MNIETKQVLIKDLDQTNSSYSYNIGYVIHTETTINGVLHKTSKRHVNLEGQASSELQDLSDHFNYLSQILQFEANFKRIKEQGSAVWSKPKKVNKA